MKKYKKIIIVGVFLLLIIITAIYTLNEAIASYNYDMDPKNGVDIMEGLNAVLILMIGGFAVLYEFDLFYTVYYFFIKPKMMPKTILNILANFSLVSIFIYWYLGNLYMGIRKYEIIASILFLMYIVFRTVYFLGSITSWSEEGDE